MVKGQLCRGMSKGLHYRPVVDEVAFDETSFDRKKGAKTVSLKIDQLISATFSITPLSLSLSLSLSLPRSVQRRLIYFAKGLSLYC